MLRNLLFIDFNQNLKRELFNEQVLKTYDSINNYIKEKSPYGLEFWKSIWIKEVNQKTMVLLLIDSNYDYHQEINKITEFIKSDSLSSLYYQIRNDIRKPDKQERISHFWGQNTITENIDNYQFNISPYSFNQPNNKFSNLLYQKIKIILKMENFDSLIIYGRTASPISILTHSFFSKILAIIPCPIVYQNMILDLQQNKVNNVFPIYQTKNNFRIGNAFDKDLIFLSPGVQGLPKNIIKAVCKFKKIYMLYCNSKKLIRDLSCFFECNSELKVINQININNLSSLTILSIVKS